MAYYGKLRTQDWPKRVYPPAHPPPGTVVTDMGIYRWCSYGKHWAEQAPDTPKLGCVLHSHAARKRAVSLKKPAADPHRAARFCYQCETMKPRSDFTRPSKGKAIFNICEPCREANRASEPDQPKKARARG